MSEQIQDVPEYLTQLDPDPESGFDDGWSPVEEAEIITLTAAQKKAVEENLSTYLSVVGTTLEMLDPYCGPVLAENLPEMVRRWSKVLQHYPNSWLTKALFSESGGVIMDWVNAVKATWPVLLRVYDHHLARTIKIMPDGTIIRVVKTKDAPPMDEFQQAYTESQDGA